MVVCCSRKNRVAIKQRLLEVPEEGASAAACVFGYYNTSVLMVQGRVLVPTSVQVASVEAKSTEAGVFASYGYLRRSRYLPYGRVCLRIAVPRCELA